MSEQPREFSPIVDFKTHANFKDFSPHIVKSSEEVEEPIPTPAPKEESAPGSALFSEWGKSGELIDPVTPAQTPVSKESGSDNNSNEQNTTDEKTESADSLQDSSSDQNPGWNEPPVPGAPPTSDPNPKL